MDKLTIQRAIPEHADVLSQLAYSSKKSWNYPSEWMELWKEDLIISETEIKINPTFILLHSDEIIGFCSLEKSGSVLEINHMWIAPEYKRKGLGQMLIIHALKDTISPEIMEIKVLSDPNAVSFYQKLGFKTISWENSLPEGRKLPYMMILPSALKKKINQNN